MSPFGAIKAKLTRTGQKKNISQIPTTKKSIKFSSDYRYTSISKYIFFPNPLLFLSNPVTIIYCNEIIRFPK